MVTKDRWKRLKNSRVGGFLLGLMFALAPALLFPLGCSENNKVVSRPTSAHIMRVRLLQGLDTVTIAASQPPLYKTGSDPTQRLLNLPTAKPYAVTLSSGQWKVGNTTLGSGELTILPAQEGSVSVNKLGYRGRYRLVPVSAGKFDVVNDVDIEAYLCGVLPRELLADWHEETYRAQAIVARTYALYEKQIAPADRYWDVYANQRSQMYGGLAAESDKSRDAVNQTAGIVLAYAPAGGEPRIFKAYFSSCCGGITQSAADAFNEGYSEPLSDQNSRALCNASPRFNWGPVTIKKEELTRRFRAWGAKRDHPIKNIAAVSEVAIQACNVWGRPTRFQVTDAKQNRYSLSSEEFRGAVNTDAPPATDPANVTTLYSSFVKVITDADSVRFVEGHGWGHGVGFCQYCGERRAELGMRHEDIVLAAFQRAKLFRAY